MQKQINQSELFGIGGNHSNGVIHPDDQGDGAESDHSNEVEIISTTDACIQPARRRRKESKHLSRSSSSSSFTKRNGDQISSHKFRPSDNVSISTVDESDR